MMMNLARLLLAVLCVCCCARAVVGGKKSKLPTAADGTPIAKTKEMFEKYGIYPDHVDQLPETYPYVEWKETDTPLLATGHVAADSTKGMPEIDFRRREGFFYTVAFLDIDFPSRINPSMGQWMQWFVMNVPWNENPWNPKAGEHVVAYSPIHPGPGTGIHRYVFLVYEHAKLIEDTMKLTRVADGKFHDRGYWNIVEFANEVASTQYKPFGEEEFDDERYANEKRMNLVAGTLFYSDYVSGSWHDDKPAPPERTMDNLYALHKHKQDEKFVKRLRPLMNHHHDPNVLIDNMPKGHEHGNLADGSQRVHGLAAAMRAKLARKKQQHDEL
jgi:hypothetical protein